MAWRCSGCNGHAVGLAVLRRSAPSERVGRFWQAALTASAGQLCCPACAAPMRRVEIDAIELDACRSCHLVWFDPTEREAFGERTESAPPIREQTLPPEAARVLATARAQQMRGRMEREHEQGTPNVTQWQYPATWFGLPVELDEPQKSRTPFVTYLLVAALMIGGPMLLESLSGTPGWVMLAISAYLVAVFADNVEDAFGPLLFVGLLAMSALASSFAWRAIAGGFPGLQVMVGGGLATVMACYVLIYPRAKLGFRWWNWWAPSESWIRVKAVWILVMFLSVQWALSLGPAAAPLAAIAALLAGVAVGAGMTSLLSLRGSRP